VVPVKFYILTELGVINVLSDTTALTLTISMRYLQQLDHRQYLIISLVGVLGYHIAVKEVGSLLLPSNSAGSVLWDTIVVMLAALKL